MIKTNKLYRFAGVVIVMIILLNCSTNKKDNVYSKYLDTTVSVYGPYKVIKLPISKGVKILNPIQIALGPNGKIFAANQGGEIYSLEDSDGDGVEDEAVLFCNVTDFKLRSPVGFAHRGDTIFIGTSQEIRAFLDANKDGKVDTSWIFFNEIPTSQHPYEWTSGLSFGPDGWLYCALSTDSWNDGASPDPKKYRGAILRISPDGKQVERVATGIRSVHGMAFNQHGDLFFADNEGGGNPKEELNHLVNGAFYGHNPKKYEGFDSITGPAHALETEMAPGGITFNRLDNPFGGTAGDLFIAFYGPGERWTRGAIGRIEIERQSDGRYTYKEVPVADIPKLSALTFSKDGSLYLAHHGLSDYWYNSVEEKSGGFYKVIYDESASSKSPKERGAKKEDASPGSIELGKQLFARRACSACHGLSGPELLGPNLDGIGSRLSREDILEDIQFPSKVIKPSMGAVRVVKKDGQVLLGRVVNADEKQISVMLIGNKTVSIPRTEIQSTENEQKSLMYENLLKGLSKEEVNSLLDYLVSIKATGN